MLFRKCRGLVAHGKWIFRKRISINRKIKAFDPENIFSQNFTFKSFPKTRKERKRERKDSHVQTKREREREREIANPENQDRCTANPQTASRTAPIAPVSRTANPRTHKPANPLPISFSFSFEIFVIKFVCDFDFLLSLFDL